MTELSLASIKAKSLKSVREASDLEREVDELYKSPSRQNYQIHE